MEQKLKVEFFWSRGDKILDKTTIFGEILEINNFL